MAQSRPALANMRGGTALRTWRDRGWPCAERARVQSRAAAGRVHFDADVPRAQRPPRFDANARGRAPSSALDLRGVPVPVCVAWRRVLLSVVRAQLGGSHL